jgi:hypothetical protein
MKSLLLLSIALSFAQAADSNNNDVKLYHDSVEQKNTGGKDLISEFTEIIRGEKTSEVIVKRTSGASVPSVMFVAKGVYSIAKIRNKKFFINLKEWRDGDMETHYIFGFADDDKVDPRKEFANQYDDAKDLGFMSVEQFSLVFEKK